MHDALQQLVDSNRRLARQAKGDAVDASMLPMRELAQALAEPDCDFSALDSDDACLCAVEKVPDLVQRKGLAVYVVRLADDKLLGLHKLYKDKSVKDKASREAGWKKSVSEMDEGAVRKTDVKGGTQAAFDLMRAALVERKLDLSLHGNLRAIAAARALSVTRRSRRRVYSCRIWRSRWQQS